MNISLALQKLVTTGDSATETMTKYKEHVHVPANNRLDIPPRKDVYKYVLGE